ncbi:UNVERIFIED_CONTAM: hypothetical protein FKN15_054690 [Acipenser sinensis]
MHPHRMKLNKSRYPVEEFADPGRIAGHNVWELKAAHEWSKVFFVRFPAYTTAPSFSRKSLVRESVSSPSGQENVVFDSHSQPWEIPLRWISSVRRKALFGTRSQAGSSYGSGPYKGPLASPRAIGRSCVYHAER